MADSFLTSGIDLPLIRGLWRVLQLYRGKKLGEAGSSQLLAAGGHRYPLAPLTVAKLVQSGAATTSAIRRRAANR